MRDPEKAARDAEALRAEVAELERRLRALRLEVAVMEGTREILKKGSSGVSVGCCRIRGR